MMLSQIQSVTLFGLDAKRVDIEVDIHRGLPSFTIVGLTDTAIQESRERIRSALKNTGFEFPRQKIVVNLAPADLRKHGPRFDLPIALGILSSTGQISLPNMEKTLVLGELSFTGEVRGVSGVLPSVHGMMREGIKEAFVPEENAGEAALIQEVEVYGVRNLREMIQHLQGTSIAPTKTSLKDFVPPKGMSEYDFVHIRGQEHAKRALEVAAAGGHNVLFVGPPGSGKTMLAKAFSTILPPLVAEEALEITQIHSIAGLTSQKKPVLAERPFRAVHHTASGVAIVGGGNPPRPGEVSLSHRGVLFLDEFAEFPQKTLEVLRQPLEDGQITVSRASGSVQFPARFMLVAAMNPTPSGYDPSDKRCTDTAYQIQRYQNKISGPLLDRIDMHVQVPHIPFETLHSLPPGEGSSVIRDRVIAARERQRNRFGSGTAIMSNAEMSSSLVKQYCPILPEAQNLLQAAVAQMDLSGRAYYRLLKVARTIADLDGIDMIETAHIAEAIGYRQRLGE